VVSMVSGAVGQGGEEARAEGLASSGS